MNAIRIAGSQSTPEIHCNPESGTVLLQGDSYPENSYELYQPVIEWIETWLDRHQHLHLELRLVYMNTSSVKAMMDIFDILEAAHQKGQHVSVDWFYDRRNERVAEMADEFREDCTFTFQIIPDA